MNTTWTSVLLACLLLPSIALGSGGPPSGMRLPDAEYDSAVAEIKLGQYEKAIPSLQTVLDRRPDDADAHNWLAYALRKLKRYAEAERHYLEALKLDPKHIGAHEYIGELYVETGLFDKARQHLATLKKLCPDGCAELRDLEKAIASGSTSY